MMRPEKILARLSILVVSGLLLWTGMVQAQIGQTLVPIDPSLREAFNTVQSDPRVVEALEKLQLREPANIEEQIRITEIPAPPFMEDERAAYYLEQLRSRGLADAYIDSEGNAIGVRRGSGRGPTLLISAHLDTVFPLEVDTTVEFRDGRYYAPGIGDDARGLAVLLAVIEVLEESGIETGADVMFAGRCRRGRPRRPARRESDLPRPSRNRRFSFPSTAVRMTRITIGGTGSRRFEFRFSGPGGHSFGSFGIASAVHAMGRAIARIAELRTPSYPKTTFTVGTVDGGTSVNSIAAGRRLRH